MSSCLDCGMELPGASFFCAYCGHRQSSTALNPTRFSRSPATKPHLSDVTMLLSDWSPMLPRREEEDYEQHRPMAPPMLLFAGQASSGSVPMFAGIPTTGNLPWIRNLLSRAALSCVTATKFALTPWIIITLTSVAILVGTGMVLPHLLGPTVSTQVNASGNSHQQVIPMPMQSGQADCLLAGNARVHDVQIQFCTSQLGKVSGNPSSSQQQGILLSNRSSSLASTVLLPHVANGKLQAAVSSPVQRLLSLNTAVLSSTPHPLQTLNVLNNRVSTVRQVVRSVVGTTSHLPQVQSTLSKSVSTVSQVVRSAVNTTSHLSQVGKTLNKSVSTVSQVVNNVVNTTTRLPQVQKVLNKTVPTVSQVVRSAVNTTSHLPQVGKTLNKSVSTVSQVVQSTVSAATQQSKAVQNTVSTVSQQPKVVQNTMSTATTLQQPKVVQSTASTPQQPKVVQSTVSTPTAKQQPRVGDVLSKSTSTIHP